MRRALIGVARLRPSFPATVLGPALPGQRDCWSHCSWKTSSSRSTASLLGSARWRSRGIDRSEGGHGHAAFGGVVPVLPAVSSPGPWPPWPLSIVSRSSGRSRYAPRWACLCRDHTHQAEPQENNRQDRLNCRLVVIYKSIKTVSYMENIIQNPLLIEIESQSQKLDDLGALPPDCTPVLTFSCHRCVPRYGVNDFGVDTPVHGLFKVTPHSTLPGVPSSPASSESRGRHDPS